MTEVLFIATKRPDLGILADSVRKFRDRDATVFLTGTFHVLPVEEELSLMALEGVHQLPRGLSTRSSSVRRKAKASPAGMRVWLQAQRDRWLRRRALKAHVIVALDPGAVYTVWRLSQYNPAAEAHFGIAAALTALDKLTRQGAVARQATLPALGAVAKDVRRSIDGIPAAMMRTATARPVMRSALGARLWRSAVSAPGVPVKARVAASRYVAEGMQWAGRTSGAAIALTTAASKIPDPAVRAELLDEGVMTEIARGISPRDLRVAVAARLAQADEQYAKGHHEAASEALNRALFLDFHRVLHIDQLSSPLAEDARNYTKRLQGSTAFQAVSRPRGRKTPAAAPP
ncbi:glycosyltransferase family 1 protein, partial [Streptomyces sp. NPDC013087]